MVTPLRSETPCLPCLKGLARAKSATVRVIDRNSRGRGVFVGGYYVLTAAHCISWDDREEYSRAEYDMVPVVRIVAHRSRRKLCLEAHAFEPCSDFAVLSGRGIDGFDEFATNTEPAPLFRGVFKADGADRYTLPVFALSRSGRWLPGTATIWRKAAVEIVLEMKSGGIGPGCSGGPVVTGNGELVGLITRAFEGPRLVRDGVECHVAYGVHLLYTLPRWVLEEIRGVAA